MSIHKTESGSYRVRYRVEGKMKSKTFQRKVDAKAFEGKQLYRKLCGEGETNSQKVEKISFLRFKDIWLRDHGAVHKTESSLIRDRQIIQDFLLPKWQRKNLSEIRHRNFISLQADLRARGSLANKSINNIVGLAKKILSDAFEWGLINSNPGLKVRPLRIPDQTFRFWTTAQRDQFLNFCQDRDEELFRVVAFTTYTGMRRGEVEGLLRDCINFERKEITIKRNFCHKTHSLNSYTKGKNIRRIPMNSAVLDLLEESKNIPPLESIFSSDFPNICRKKLKPMAKRAEVPVITFHDLRHSFASNLASLGVPVMKIKELLGHSDLKTTLRYMHLAPDQLAGTTDILISKPIRKKFLQLVN